MGCWGLKLGWPHSRQTCTCLSQCPSDITVRAGGERPQLLVPVLTVWAVPSSLATGKGRYCPIRSGTAGPLRCAPCSAVRDKKIWWWNRDHMSSGSVHPSWGHWPKLLPGSSVISSATGTFPLVLIWKLGRADPFTPWVQGLCHAPCLGPSWFSMACAVDVPPQDTLCKAARGNVKPFSSLMHEPAHTHGSCTHVYIPHMNSTHKCTYHIMQSQPHTTTCTIWLATGAANSALCRVACSLLVTGGENELELESFRSQRNPGVPAG